MDSCYCGFSQNVGEVSGGFETNFSISRLDRYLRIGTTLYSRKRHWIKMEIQQKWLLSLTDFDPLNLLKLNEHPEFIHYLRRINSINKKGTFLKEYWQISKMVHVLYTTL